VKRGHSSAGAVGTYRQPPEQPGTASTKTRNRKSPCRCKMGKEQPVGFGLRTERAVVLMCAPEKGRKPALQRMVWGSGRKRVVYLNVVTGRKH